MTELSERAGTYGMGVLRIGTPHETDRLRLIAETYDPHTLDHLVRLGIGPGWHASRWAPAREPWLGGWPTGPALPAA